MINRIRLATKEEIEAIKATADCGTNASVLALDTPEGTPLAVVRNVVEVDPVMYPEKLSNRMKAMFQRDVETVLAAQGVLRYYFNVHADNKAMIDAVKSWGAVEQSTAPEIRFLKVL